jgi:hypothetical protein
MKSINHALKTGLLSVAAAGVLSGIAGAAAASENGGTDIYRNEFPAAFGSATQGSHPGTAPQAAVGSTDIYANQFLESFGQAGPVLARDPDERGAVGSTDIWGANAFQRSFGPAAS